MNALGQGGKPEDVGQAIAFLATPGAQGVTGQVLRVCGAAMVGA
jgi:3-oxoacyl-[acyl-carrier protein] reductase